MKFSTKSAILAAAISSTACTSMPRNSNPDLACKTMGFCSQVEAKVRNTIENSNSYPLETEGYHRHSDHKNTLETEGEHTYNNQKNTQSISRKRVVPNIVINSSAHNDAHNKGIPHTHRDVTLGNTSQSNIDTQYQEPSHQETVIAYVQAQTPETGYKYKQSNDDFNFIKKNPIPSTNIQSNPQMEKSLDAVYQRCLIDGEKQNKKSAQIHYDTCFEKIPKNPYLKLREAQERRNDECHKEAIQKFAVDNEALPKSCKIIRCKTEAAILGIETKTGRFYNRGDRCNDGEL